MQTALADELRIDYDPETGECLGTLIEEARTNLLTYSEDFSNAAWVKSGAAVTADAITAPDGELTADRIVESASTAEHRLEQVPTLTPSTKYVFSLFAKKDARFVLSLRLADAGWATTAATNFDLASGTVTSSTSEDEGMIDCGNGWYRCWISSTTAASGTTRVRVNLIDDETAIYLGDGTSGLYIWGAQLEEGETPSSYIPTTTAAVTRSDDVLSMEGTDFSDWYNQNEGSIIVDYKLFPSIENTRIIAISDTALTSDSIFIARSGNGAAILVQVFSGSSLQTAIGMAASREGVVAAGYKTNDFALSQEGVAVVTDGDGNVPSGVDRMYIGSSITVNVPLNGHIKQLQYYPKRLTNTELQALSA
jgi:hypothetical protein